MFALTYFADSSRTSPRSAKLGHFWPPQAGPRDFAERNVMERSAASIRLGPRELDNLAPLLGFGGNELGEVGGRTGKHCSTKVGKPRSTWDRQGPR